MRTMLRIMFVVVLCPYLSTADELTAEKKAAIKDLVVVSGGAKMGVMMSDYMVRSVLVALSAVDSTLTSEDRDIIAGEVGSVLQEEMADSGSYWEVLYPIYHKYFTMEEVVQIRAFYDTEVGQKMIAVMPTMLQETMDAAKAWGESLRTTLIERVKERLARDDSSGNAK